MTAFDWERIHDRIEGMLREAIQRPSATRPPTGRPIISCRTSQTVNVRSIFISDVHLGTRGCQADRLLDFLRDYESEHLYLIGDIIDFWSMNRGIHWTRHKTPWCRRSCAAPGTARR
jgi:hypothetical protein